MRVGREGGGLTYTGFREGKKDGISSWSQASKIEVWRLAGAHDGKGL